LNRISYKNDDNYFVTLQKYYFCMIKLILILRILCIVYNNILNYFKIILPIHIMILFTLFYSKVVLTQVNYDNTMLWYNYYIILI